MNTHFFIDKVSSNLVSCSKDNCEICGVETRVVDSYEDIDEDTDAQQELILIEKHLPEGIETTFGYLCPSCIATL